MELIGLQAQRYDIGRAAVFRRDVWDGTDDLFDPAKLIHVGNTEGELDIEPNAEFSDLTLEVTGPAILRRFLSGESPSFTLGVFPSPSSLKLFSPTGRGSAGHGRRIPLREHTLWIEPEELFIGEDEEGLPVEVPVTWDGVGDAFLKDGEPLTESEQELADMSLVIWKATIERASPVYRHEDGGKSLREITVNLLQDFARPEGCQLYLVMGEHEDFDELDFTPA
jgi:hypothetical protein